MKLRDQVIVALLLTALLSVVAAGGGSLVVSTKQLERSAQDVLFNNTLKRANHINDWVEMAVQRNEILARMPIIHNVLAKELERVATSGEELDPDLLYRITTQHLISGLLDRSFSEIFIVDVTDGAVIASTDEKHLGKIYSRKPFFQRGLQESRVENIFYSMSLRQPTMVTTTPIIGSQGEAVGLLCGRMNLESLSKILEKWSGMWETEDIYLVNNQNIFITEPLYGERYMLRKTVNTTGVNRALEGRQGVDFYKDYRGVDVVGAYMYLPDQDMALITEIDKEEYLQPLEELKSQLFTIAVAIAVIVLALGGLMAHLITRPLTRLSRSIKEIDSRNLQLHFESSFAGGEVKSIVTSFIDMLERLRQSLVSKEKLEAEVARRATAELELRTALDQVKRSNSELEQFAYVASHDLQEPLRMVASYNQLLAERYGPQLDDRAQKYIHYAVDGSRRMATLINELLNLSRITTRGGELIKTNFSEVVDIACKNLEVVIAEQQAEINVRPMPVVLGDKSQLIQLVQNLLANGIKFRSDRKPQIEIAAQVEAGEYRFSVRDNGIGIDQKFTEKIFVIFQRLHTREEYEGTGIGLALCKKIVERHGGTIWFNSEPGDGTTFYFTLKPADDL